VPQDGALLDQYAAISQRTRSVVGAPLTTSNQHARSLSLSLSLSLSPGPFSQYTHWKQTVFYLEEVLLVTEGDVIEGTLSCQQNKKNKRDLDIVIEYTHESKYGTVSRSQQFFLR